jgi:hypothetical protein
MSRNRRDIIVLWFIALSFVFIHSGAQAEEFFTDITSSAGIAGIGTGGHGLGIGDINGDGLLDMYVTNSFGGDTLINHLFINQSNNVFVDFSVDVGVDDSENIGGHGVVLVDIDNDQDLDIYIGNMGPGGEDYDRNTLFRNDGNLSFLDVSYSAGIGIENSPTRGVAALDVDSDGDLDLVSSPFVHTVKLYINDGTGYFTAETRGIEDDGLAKQGVSTIDIELDGDVDLYVNKWGQSPNRLFLNDGLGFFAERAGSLGVDTDEYHNNGGTFGDIDNDSDLDLFVFSKSGSSPYLQVYRNENGYFVDETSIHNIVGDGFSAALGDVDNDGDLDLFLPRSYLVYALYQNDGFGYFNDREGSGVEVTGEDARSASFADFDNDGDLDLMVVQKRGYSHYFRNDTDNSLFVELRLIGPSGEKYCMGTKAELYEAGHGGDEYYFKGYREISSAMAYLSQVSPVIHFGLDEAVNSDILLTFPTGEELLLKNLAPGEIMDLDARNISPQDFELYTPWPGDTVTEPSVYLDWEDSFDPNPWDSVLYDLYYGTSQVFEPSSTYFVQGLNESEFSLQAGLLTEVYGNSTGADRIMKSSIVYHEESFDDVMIHWKVEARDTRNELSASIPEQSNFWISRPERPSSFDLILPADGDSISVGNSILFVWNRSYDPDPYDSLLTYYIVVGLDSAISETLWTSSTFADTFLLIDPIEVPMVFYWSVVAEGMDGLSQASTMNFECRVVDDFGGSGIGGSDQYTGELPRALELSQNYPNPFNPSTMIRIAIPGGGNSAYERTILRVYSLRGRIVRTLFDGQLEPGVHVFAWDGLDDRYTDVPSGAYFAVLQHGRESRKVKILLNR